MFQINLEVNDLDSQFADGVYLCLLSGLLEGYFVPLYDFHLTPQVKHFRPQISQILGFIANSVLSFCEYLIHFSLLVL